MATEDDTFDIDIYGDEPTEGQGANVEEYELDFSTTETITADESTTQAVAGEEQAEELQTTTEAKHADSQDLPQPQQGTKRKAPDDGNEDSYEADYDSNNPAVHGFATSLDASHTSAQDPYAMPALRLTELQWWTTEEDLRSYCAKAGAESQLKDLSFGEHKINGKSRGEAYLEFDSASTAEKVKTEVEKAVEASASESGAKRKDWLVEYTHVGNGFKMAAGSTAPKKEYSQQGGYNRGNYNNADRGNFHSRGNFQRGGFQNRGAGGFNNRGGMYQQSNPSQGGWGGGGGGGMMPGMGGAGFNPMMAGMNMMGQFNNNMSRGGMMGMNTMGMGRGGMMGMNMGMMGRGAWNGGMNGGFQGQGNGMGQQGWQGGGGGGMGQGNKRAKME